MTAKEFQQSEAKRTKLAQLLNNQVLKEAIAIIEEELKPRGDLAIFQSLEVSAHRYHQSAGMTYLTDGLKRLSTPPAEAPKIPRGKSLRSVETPLDQNQ